MSVKEMVIVFAVLAFGYWLGTKGVLAAVMPG
jgi:hypothetical protein